METDWAREFLTGIVCTLVVVCLVIGEVSIGAALLHAAAAPSAHIFTMILLGWTYGLTLVFTSFIVIRAIQVGLDLLKKYLKEKNL